MSDQQRAILEQVASGDLTPEEAAARLGDLHDETSEAGLGDQTEVHPPREASSVTTVKVTGSFQTTQIVGDPSVRTAIADGPHQIRHDGDTMTISTEEHVEGRRSKNSYSYKFSTGKGAKKTVVDIGGKPAPLKIRMNPALALQAQIAAGSLKVEGVTGPIDAQISAGSVRIEGFQSPVNIQVAGGVVSATGRLDHGESRIVCEAGKVSVRLLPGSSVKVIGRAGLGKVELPGAGSTAFIGGGQQEATIGDGAGTLQIDASMGLVSVEEG